MIQNESGTIIVKSNDEFSAGSKQSYGKKCHCFCFSYNIHMPIEQEEYLADWISLYGTDLIYLLDDLMSNIDWRAA